MSAGAIHLEIQRQSDAAEQPAIMRQGTLIFRLAANLPHLCRADARSAMLRQGLRWRDGLVDCRGSWLHGRSRRR